MNNPKISRPYTALGLMSGTSLDGLDRCLVQFSPNGAQLDHEILAADTLPYSAQWQERLSMKSFLVGEELVKMHLAYGQYLGQMAQDFLNKNHCKSIDLVSSHGHTIWHQPQHGFTFQLGYGGAIRLACEQTVVCDFRTQDVLLGGQGAPLVPIGDAMLFGSYDVCLNLGGFSNASWSANGQRKAMDLSPMNLVLNPLAKMLGADYDDKGHWARQGQISQPLLEALNGLPFYALSAPKSLGREWLESEFWPLFHQYPCAIYDQMATLVEHIAIQLKQFIQIISGQSVLVTGGGAHHQFLLERLQCHCPNVHWQVPDPVIIEQKEALIFALLGVLRLENIPNVLASVTGAQKDHCSGVVFS